MPTSTLTSQGQTTIPKEIREHLDLQPGNRIDFVVREDGSVVIRPATHDIGDLAGMLHEEGRPPVTVADMNAAIRGRFGSDQKPDTASRPDPHSESSS